jgi:DNA-binding CsgD family transcriptional regulator
MTSMRPGVVDIVDACYRFDGEPETWMRSVGDAVEKHLGYGLGAIAMRYRLDERQMFSPLAIVPVNMTEEAPAIIQRALAGLPPIYMKETFGSLPADVASRSGSPEVQRLTDQGLREHFEPHGWHDILNINGLDPTQHGFVVGTMLPKRGALTPRMRTRWSRVAAHFAAAHRLRTRLTAAELQRADGADAVLTASGRVEHATGEATLTDARARLAEGVRMLDRARGKLRRDDPDLALAEWRALLAARWTLIEHFESDGKRYVLARRNAAVPSGLDALTARERQALGFAQLGHSNKLTAYEMGISASTVAVLLYRAAKKLGCERDELVATYTRMLRGSRSEPGG